MTKQENEFILMCAVDYAINRHTYAPNEMVRILTNYWNEYSVNLKRYIVAEIKNHELTADPVWFKILEL